MKSIILKSALFIAIAAGLATGCESSDDYSAPVSNCVDPGLTANKTIQEVIGTRTGANTLPVEYTADDVIEGYVTSSDEKGNFFKVISLQTIPTDNSQPVGFSISVNLYSTFGLGFEPGRKVYIKLKGLYTAKVDGALQIGELYQASPTAALAIGRISENTYKNYLFPSCSSVSEDSFVRSLSLAQAFTDANLNTLVEIENVRFVDASAGRTYYDVDSGGGATNHNIVDNAGGASKVIRFSSFAPFSGNSVPTGVGKIRGVMTKYGSTYQFMVRYESDIKLGASRTFNFSGSFTENFQSYPTSQDNFPNYINDPIVGNKSWFVKAASGNNFLEMTSFNSNEVNRTLFAIPIDFTAASTFTFQYKVDFLVTGHVPLKVYYAKDYTIGGSLNGLVNITSQFSNLATQTSTSFTSAGIYNIPADLTGNGFIILEYTGTGIAPRLTTNLDIDNIVVN